MDNGKNIKRFSVIEGGNSPSADMRAESGEERVSCHVCVQHEGVDTVVMIPVHTMVVRKDNELKPVITKMQCMGCLLKGRITYLA